MPALSDSAHHSVPTSLAAVGILQAHEELARRLQALRQQRACASCDFSIDSASVQRPSSTLVNANAGIACEQPGVEVDVGERDEADAGRAGPGTRRRHFFA